MNDLNKLKTNINSEDIDIEALFESILFIENLYCREDPDYSKIRNKLDELKDKYSSFFHLINDKDLIMLENIQLECLKNLNLYVEAYLNIGTFYLLDNNVSN